MNLFLCSLLIIELLSFYHVSSQELGWPLAGSGFKEGMDSLKLVFGPESPFPWFKSQTKFQESMQNLIDRLSALNTIIQTKPDKTGWPLKDADFAKNINTIFETMNKMEPKLKKSFGINVKRRQVVNIGQGEFSNSVFNGRKRSLNMDVMKMKPAKRQVVNIGVGKFEGSTFNGKK